MGPMPQPAAQPEPRQFDLCGPLPEPGVTILEASAGTGKTFTIAALVARLVAEDIVPLDRILVVTFTRMATGELRDRVRARLVSAEAALGRCIGTGDAPPDGDAVLALLARGERDVLALRRQRLADALANFDSATITTTHGFCHTVLAALGVWGNVAPGASLLEDPRDLVQEVTDDLLARHVIAHGALPFRRRDALEIVTAAVSNPGAVLGPGAVTGDTTAGGLRRRLAQGARVEVARRLLGSNLLTYDDLLVRLARALSDPVRGGAARSRLAESYQVVLVDEFQDTDLVQWEIVSRAFAGGNTRLVLVGDPKQAVYAFRGADVYAYLAAARSAAPGHRFTLDVNWRSDADLLVAFDALLGPLHLGHSEIRYRQACATPCHGGSRLKGAPVGAPLRARLLDRTDRRLAHTGSGLAQKDSALKCVAKDLATDIVGLLGSGAELLSDDPGEQGGDGHRPVGPQDIGVLVRTNRQAAIVQAELRAARVPVVVSGAQSVLSTAAARDWLRLLEALEQPSDRSLAAAAAMGDLVGMTAEQLANADETAWEALHYRLHEWAALARRGGVAALFGDVSASQRLPARLLREIEGERRLTDLGHIAELLHAEATGSQLGLTALRAWLSRRIDEASPEGADAEQRSRRLDSGSAAVQILTVHRAKGLEFPIVYCPYLWDGAARGHYGAPVIFHEPSEQDQRKLDVGAERGDRTYEDHFAASQAETRGEEIRHLYVALSRAKHQVVLWWAPVQDCQHSALGRLLLSKDANGDVAPSGGRREPRDAEVRAAFQRVAARAPSLVSVEPGPVLDGRLLNEIAARPAAAPETPVGDLRASSFDRELDLGWKRASYTSITATAHMAGPVAHGAVAGAYEGAAGDLRAGQGVVSSEPEDPGTIDEPLVTPPGMVLGSGRSGHPPSGRGPVGRGDDDENGQEPSGPVPSPLATMPVGADVGTFVHSIFERVDFSSDDLRSALHRAVEGGLARYPGPPGDIDMLVTGLEAAMTTPLGALVGGTRLRDLSRTDRLDELRFELPLAGGDQPVGEVLIADLARLFAKHVRPGQLLAGYDEALESRQLAPTVRGYLTGSLDLVFRRHGCYFVADYKTNWLGPDHERLTAWHYRPSALEGEMLRAHYPLQALFYLVALHRYLRWRLPGYQPTSHLGGALYLFVRGMVGPHAPSFEGAGPCGVFSWSPPVALVTELSDLLAGAATGTAQETGPRAS